MPVAVRDALATVLDAGQGEVRRRTHGVLGEEGFEPVYGMPHAEHRERTLQQLRRVAAAGLAGMALPAEHGGGGDLAGFHAFFYDLALGDLSLAIKIGVQQGLFGGAVQHLGSERHRSTYLPGVADASLLGCFAMTEVGHGSDVASLRTTATYDPATETFDLHTPDLESWKDYIGNAAAHARWAAVFAQLVTDGEPRGVHVLVVRIREEDGTVAEGVTIGDDGHKVGLNGVDNGRLAFDHVTVPRDALLDRYGQVAPDGTYSSDISSDSARFFAMLGALVNGRIIIAGSALGAAKVAMVIAVRHAVRREQFPDGEGGEIELLDYVVHQRRLLPRLARTYALHFAQQELLALHVRVQEGAHEPGSEDQRRLETRTAGHKAMTTWHTTDTIQEAREACGGFGYLSENVLGQLKADTDVYTTFEGANHVLLQLVGKTLLTGFREDLEARDALATARFVTDEAFELAINKLRVRSAGQTVRDAFDRDGDGRLLDREFQRLLFTQRQERMLARVATRIRSLSSDHGPEVAFLRCQDEVLAAASAHVEAVVFEAFASAVEDCDDPAVAAELDRLCDLHALATVEEHLGWYVVNGVLSPGRGDELGTTVTALCRELRPRALDLVEAFGFPEELLRAPIAVRGDDEPYLAARERLGTAPDA